jgi:hypothetical protein
VPDVHRRVRGVQPGDVGAQLTHLGSERLDLSHNTSIRALMPMSTGHGRGRLGASKVLNGEEDMSPSVEHPGLRPASH